jgi:ankyrin repeat protein
MVFKLFGSGKKRVAELMAAARTGDISKVQELLSKGTDINAFEPESGDTPLLAAIDKGQWATAEFLLTQGPNLTQEDKNGNSPLYLSVSRGDAGLAIVKQLLKAGVPADLGPMSGQNEGVTPLHISCALGTNECLEVLLAYGASVTRLLPDGSTPLHTTAVGGNEKTVDLLCEAGCSLTAVNHEGRTPLHNSGITGNAKVAEALIKQGASVDSKDAENCTPLMQAVINNHPEVAEVFLDNGADPDVVVQNEDAVLYPLFVAAINGYDDMVRVLLAKGVNVVAKVDGLPSPLEAARHNGHDGSAKQIADAIKQRKVTNKKTLNAGQNVSRLSIDAQLIAACAAGNDKIVLELLHSGADVNMRSSNGLTPLMYAAQNGDSKCVDLFLDAGADINSIENERGVGAFGLAISQLNLDMAEHLLEKGATPNFGSIETLPLAIAEHGSLKFIKALKDRGCILVQDEQRAQMAFVSARNPDPEVFAYLIEQGADPSADNNLGYTPLILAALNDHSSLIHRYLERGEDANTKDVDGETALSLAIEKRHDASVTVLRKFHVEEGDYAASSPDDAMLQAAEDGMLGTVLNLREAGVSLNCRDNEGNTPLMRAVKARQLGVVRSLYHLGADINHRNHTGDSALSIAIAAEFFDIVNTLQEFGALDTESSELPEYSTMLEGSPVYNAADTMFGRMSHPYKDIPPYENNDTSTECKAVNDQLIEAVQSADLAAVKKILKSGGNVNEVDEEGNPLLLLAVLTRQTKMVEELLKLGADPNQVRPDGKGPLFGALRNHDDKITKMLLKSGAEADARITIDHNGTPVDGCTALYVAAMLGQLTSCKALLDTDANLEATNDIGYTPLIAAIEGDHEEVVEFLLKAGANINPEVIDRMDVVGLGGSFPLYSATRIENVAIIKRLIKHGAEIDRTTPIGWSSLKCAALQGSLGIVKILLEAGADPNTQSSEFSEENEWEPGRTALMDAAFNGNVPIARELLKHGADVDILNSEGRTALHSAVVSANLDMVSLLLQSGADPDIFGNDNERMSALDLALRCWAKADQDDRGGGVTAVLELMLKKGMPSDDGCLMSTALNLVAAGHIEVVSILKKHDFEVDPNYLIRGVSYLFFSTILGDEPAVDNLIKIGADTNYKNRSGLSVLSMAARSGSIKIVELLIAAGANVLDKNLNNALPYDLAVIYGHDVLAELLIERMNQVVPEIDRQDNKGATLLMNAAVAADLKMLEDLIDAGADPSRRDRTGHTPLSYAVSHDLEQVVKILRDAGVEKLPNAEIIGEESLVKAADLGALGTILDILDAGCDIDLVNANGDTALTAAIVHPGIVQVLAKRGANLSHRNQSEQTAFMIAASSNRTLMMQLLEELGSPVEEPTQLDGISQVQAMVTSMNSIESEKPSLEDETLSLENELLSASLIGDAVAVSRLIDAGAEVNYLSDEGRTALLLALGGYGSHFRQGILTRRTERDFEQIIDCLLVTGADPNTGFKPPLMLAVVVEKVHIVRALICAGADINASATMPTDEDKGTMLVNALMLALTPGDDGTHIDENLSLALIEAGTDLSFRSDDGSLAIHFAARLGLIKTLRLIGALAPDTLNTQDDEGVTPLMSAVMESHSEAVNVLLEMGASQEFQDMKQRTAKEIAAIKGHGEIVAILEGRPETKHA